MSALDYDRETIGAAIGTLTGTILQCPINLTGLIYGVRAAALFSVIGTSVATLSVITAELNSNRLGTITGTIDILQVVPGGSELRDDIAEKPIGVIRAGESLTGRITMPNAVASLSVVIVYSFVPGRYNPDAS